MPDLEVRVSGPADRALQEAGIRTLQDLSAIRRRRLPRCTGSARSDEGRTEALAQHGLEFAGTESDAEEHLLATPQPVSRSRRSKSDP